MTAAPLSLDAVQAITNPVDRANACTEYIHNGADKIALARRIRDAAITELLDQGHGVSTVAAATGMSTSHVKDVRKYRAVIA